MSEPEPPPMCPGWKDMQDRLEDIIYRNFGDHEASKMLAMALTLEISSKETYVSPDGYICRVEDSDFDSQWHAEGFYAYKVYAPLEEMGDSGNIHYGD